MYYYRGHAGEVQEPDPLLEVKKLDQPMTDSHFRAMALMFRIRDLVRPRRRILEEARLRRGMTVLDYGCGPGSYTILAARAVGPAGRVHAADIHHLAVRRVEELALAEGLANVWTVRTDRATGLPDGSVDTVLLYDVLHDLTDPRGVLAELHRVLGPGGTLSVSDHHMSFREAVDAVTRDGLFDL